MSRGVLLLAVCAAPFPGFVAANAAPTTGVPSICSELTQRRDGLHAEIERLRAETSLVEAQLGALCTGPRNQSSLGAPHPTGAITGIATDVVPRRVALEPNVEDAPPARRSGDSQQVYAVHCWGARSAFSDPSCNCLGEAPHPKLASRRTITIVVGSWYVYKPRPSACLRSPPFRTHRAKYKQLGTRLDGVPRLAAAADAFLLKIAIEERLGYPVQLVSDGLLDGVGSALNLSGTTSVYSALASGDADIYPEARRPTHLSVLRIGWVLGLAANIWVARGEAERHV
jgi:hypothetical protein